MGICWSKKKLSSIIEEKREPDYQYDPGAEAIKGMQQAHNIVKLLWDSNLTVPMHQRLRQGGAKVLDIGYYDLSFLWNPLILGK